MKYFILKFKNKIKLITRETSKSKPCTSISTISSSTCSSPSVTTTSGRTVWVGSGTAAIVVNTIDSVVATAVLVTKIGSTAISRSYASTAGANF